MASPVDPARLVIFDLDGTLTDSAPGVVASFRHALTCVGAPIPQGDLAAIAVGPPMHLNLAQMGLGDRVEEAIAAYRAHYGAHGWSMNALFDGIADLLVDLRDAGVRLAVATSKAEPVARRILDHFGIAGHFEVIAGATLDGTRAAKADVLAHALAQLHPLPQNVVMVGDRSHDVQGAAEHGIPAVVVGWGYGAGDPIDPAAAVTHVGTVAELRQVLGLPPEATVSDTADRTPDPALHVTFVCTGNICRSPMAEKMFAHQIDQRGLAGLVRVTSAGTGDWHVGDGADHRAVRVLGERGYPTAHRAAQIGPDHLSADMVVALGRNHFRILADMGVDPGRLRMLRSFDPRSQAHAPDVEDPYYGGPADFAATFEVIDAALPGLHSWVDERLAH